MKYAQASAAGADIITILAQAEDSSIKGAVEEAKKLGKKILVDMIAVKDIKTRAAELDMLGVIISVYTQAMIYKRKVKIHSKTYAQLKAL